MNRYHELTEYLFSLNSLKKPKTGLLPPRDLAEKLGHPERQFPSVHIAGTNGKGTVAVKLAAVLQENGYRVGLFTSPHLYTYRERIQINGVMISEEDVVSLLDKILSLAKDPKFFEITTLLAFHYFAEEEVDIAIIETGVGGRFDATNIIDPILSIITSIDYDHSLVLGKTLDAISKAKGGIIKKNTPVVLGKSAARQSILDIAKEKGAPVLFSRERGVDIAWKALKHLPFNIETTDCIKQMPPCRFEKRGDLLLDVAHNPAAFVHLFEKIKKEYQGKKIHVLLGMSKGKEVKASLEVIEKYADHIALLPKVHPRLMSQEEFTVGVPMTFDRALSHAKKEGALSVVTGSFYIMGLSRKSAFPGSPIMFQRELLET